MIQQGTTSIRPLPVFTPPDLQPDEDPPGPDGRRRPRGVAWTLRSVPGLARVLRMPPRPAATPARFARDLAAAVPDLRRIARRFVSQDWLADDLVQLTCLRALERQAQFVLGTNLLGWLSTILRNLHRDELRRRRYQGSLENQLGEIRRPGGDERREETPTWTHFTVEDVREAVRLLPEEMREAYVLYTFEDLSYVAIARRLNVPMATVATRLYRARLKLRELLTARLAPPGTADGRRTAADAPAMEVACAV